MCLWVWHNCESLIKDMSVGELKHLCTVKLLHITDSVTGSLLQAHTHTVIVIQWRPCPASPHLLFCSLYGQIESNGVKMFTKFGQRFQYCNQLINWLGLCLCVYVSATASVCACMCVNSEYIYSLIIHISSFDGTLRITRGKTVGLWFPLPTQQLRCP